MMMLIPEAWAGNPLMDNKRRAFYEYNAALMEPWDGPAAVAFTNGRQIGATLDRNGLRPARYYVTSDDRVMMASEMGVLPVAEEKIIEKWRLQPGKMLLIDLEAGRIISDDEIKASLSTRILMKNGWRAPRSSWKTCPPRRRDPCQLKPHRARPAKSLRLYAGRFEIPAGADGRQWRRRHRLHGHRHADLGTVGKIKAALHLFQTEFCASDQSADRPDPRRVGHVACVFIGPRPNLLDLEGTSGLKRLEVAQPILSNDDLEKIRRISDIEDNDFHAVTLDMTWDVAEGVAGLAARLDELCSQAEHAIAHSHENIIILSDRNISAERIAIPALLATAAVHHHLIRAGLRTQAGLVIETGEAREVHHFCCLAGYGAEAINPYLAFDTVDALRTRLRLDLSREEAHAHYIKATGKGIRKVMSKMGISTYQSYCGAQIFDAVGLAQSFVDSYFSGTATTIEGIGLNEVGEETIRRHMAAFGAPAGLANALDVGGEYAVRVRGEDHVWNAETVGSLQHAVRGDSRDQYREYARLINAQDENLLTLRGLFKIRQAADSGRKPVALEEVEPVTEIVRRFATGAMSLGSISPEAHETLAIAEPHWRQIEHRRRRRRIGALQPDGKRRLAPLGHQTGGLRALWCHHRISRQFRHDTD